MTVTRFLLNGQPRSLGDIEPTRTVLQHLRLHEKLTATKEGCAEGDCGACTVAIGMPSGDGLAFKAVNACIMLMRETDGCVVATAEGLADTLNGRLHPAQQVLIDQHGSQCGFCTPGFVMSLFAFERNGATAGPDAIHEMLSGNLCRCTGYRPIVAAAQSLAERGADSGFDAKAMLWRGKLDALMAEPIADVEAPETLEALDQALAARPNAKLLAGGTDLGVGIAKHGTNPGPLISLRRVKTLEGIEEREDCLVIGARASYTPAIPALERHFPDFAAIVRRIGSRQIRNLGTMGGNVCNASPIGDCAPCLLALGAELEIRGAGGMRLLPIDSFFTAYRRTALAPGEYLAAIRIPYMKPGSVFRAYKLAKRYEQDISTVAGAFWLDMQEGRVAAARIGFGGMAATPARARAVEAALLDTSLDEAAVTAAAAALARDFKPLSDFRGSAAYRLTAGSGLIRRLSLAVTQPETPVEVWQL